MAPCDKYRVNLEIVESQYWLAPGVLVRSAVPAKEEIGRAAPLADEIRTLQIQLG